MADPKQSPNEQSGEDHGEFAGEVPVEEWIPTPVSDSSDYLDRPAPKYERDQGEDDGE